MTNLNERQEQLISELLETAANASAAARPQCYEEVYNALRGMDADFRRKLEAAKMWHESFGEHPDPVAFMMSAYEVGFWLDSANRHDEVVEHCARALSQNVGFDESGSIGMVRWLFADALRHRDGETVESINEYLIVIRPALDELRDPRFHGRIQLQFALALVDLRRLAAIETEDEVLDSIAVAEELVDVAIADAIETESSHDFAQAAALRFELKLLQQERRPSGGQIVEDLDAAFDPVSLSALLTGNKIHKRNACLLKARALAVQGRTDESLAMFARAEKSSKKVWVQAIVLESRVYRARFLDQLGRHDEAREARAGAAELLSLFRLERLKPLVPNAL